MDKFLEIVYESQIEAYEIGDKYIEIFEPFMNRLNELVSNALYNELDELFNECMAANNSFYAVAGMKLAIGIQDGTFVPLV